MTAPTARSPRLNTRNIRRCWCGGADFRFQPISGLAEPASGPTQFGLSFNDWGDRFATSNTFHLHHAVIPMNYLTRSPALTVPAVSEYLYPRNEEALRVYQLTPPQRWREERTRVRQQRYKENGGRGWSNWPAISRRPAAAWYTPATRSRPNT